MAKTVGIITFHHAYNFGAVLQAYALQRTILSLGNSCAIINYECKLNCHSYYLFRYSCSAESIVHNFRSLVTLRAQKKLRKCFSDFQARYLFVTPKSYRLARDLIAIQNDFEIFVTGSDQVWNPAMTGPELFLAYYLDFVDFGRRVAYAPSFGLNEIPDNYRNQISSHLRKFDFLSVREDTGCKIIKELTGREASLVLDPTLLLPLAEYDKVTVSPVDQKPYILLYPMQCSEELRRLARNVRECLKLPIVAVVPINQTPKSFSFADKVVFDAGPSEFLGWIKNATFVCTNSFHGTVFSIIYRKNFLSSPSLVGNTRSHNLLDRVGLLSRQLIGSDVLKSGDLLFEPINYIPVEIKLKQAIDVSISYLKQALL